METEIRKLIFCLMFPLCAASICFADGMIDPENQIVMDSDHRDE